MPVDDGGGEATATRQGVPRKASVVADAAGWIVALDGAPAKTPAGAVLRTPTQALAEALAREWNREWNRERGDGRPRPDPHSLPLTRLANSAIDGVARDPGATRADLARYAASDLLCYRATDPASLVKAQAVAWDPILDWARRTLGARFVLSEGVVFVEQPPDAIAAVRAAVDEIATPFGLAALHVTTDLTSSILLALALARGRSTLDEAWRAAHVDEDEQIKTWGEDAEVTQRRALRFADMAAAADMFKLAEDIRA
jgi:chaperone required for assembly of F1-ATPase